MGGLRLVSGLSESRELVFSPSRSNLGLVSSRFAGFVRNREIYNLGMVSGPVLLKIKGKSWIFILFGIKKLKKNGKVGRNRSICGPRLIRLAKSGISAVFLIQNPGSSEFVFVRDLENLNFDLADSF